MPYEQLEPMEISPSAPRKPLMVAHSAEEWRQLFGGAPTALSIGNFDGVHSGHRKILEDVAQRAHQSGWMSAVLTFDPHPTKVLRPEAAPLQIETLAQRLEGFWRNGIAANGIGRSRFEASRPAEQKQCRACRHGRNHREIDLPYGLAEHQRP